MQYAHSHIHFVHMHHSGTGSAVRYSIAEPITLRLFSSEVGQAMDGGAVSALPAPILSGYTQGRSRLVLEPDRATTGYVDGMA